MGIVRTGYVLIGLLSLSCGHIRYEHLDSESLASEAREEAIPVAVDGDEEVPKVFLPVLTVRVLLSPRSPVVLNDVSVLIAWPAQEELGGVLDGGEISIRGELDGQPVPVELDHFDAVTGEAYVWARVPVVDSATDYEVTLHFANDDAVLEGPALDVSTLWSDAGFVEVWHLGESASGNDSEYVESAGSESRGQGGEGIASALPTQVDGKVGNAQFFDGVDDIIRIYGGSARSTQGLMIRHKSESL